jgi:hypothetical protein
LFVLVNNHAKPVELARQLTGHFLACNHLSPAICQVFEDQVITRPISGLTVTNFPLWKLGCLLGENWLEEDVANALSELLYFRHGAASTDVKPTTLFLPTSFFTDSCYLYHQKSRCYSQNLVALRGRLRGTNVQSMSILHCDGNHYSAYNYQAGIMEYGDTRGGPQVALLLQMLHLCFAGCCQA